MQYPIPDSEYERIMNTPVRDLRGEDRSLVEAQVNGQIAIWNLCGTVEGGLAVWLAEAKSYLGKLLELVDDRELSSAARKIAADARAFRTTPHDAWPVTP